MFGQATLHRRNPLSKKRATHRGIATVELALCLPVLALICFGSIQASSSILLRHRTVSVLEMGTLNFMLGHIHESDLAEHIESLSKEFELIGSTVTVTPETIDDTNYLRIVLKLPIGDNTTSPMFVSGFSELSSEMLIYRP